jgi:hypothetical protein
MAVQGEFCDLSVENPTACCDANLICSRNGMCVPRPTLSPTLAPTQCTKADLLRVEVVYDTYDEARIAAANLWSQEREALALSSFGDSEAIYTDDLLAVLTNVRDFSTLATRVGEFGLETCPEVEPSDPVVVLAPEHVDIDPSAVDLAATAFRISLEAAPIGGTVQVSLASSSRFLTFTPSTLTFTPATGATGQVVRVTVEPGYIEGQSNTGLLYLALSSPDVPSMTFQLPTSPTFTITPPEPDVDGAVRLSTSDPVLMVINGVSSNAVALELKTVPSSIVTVSLGAMVGAALSPSYEDHVVTMIPPTVIFTPSNYAMPQSVRFVTTVVEADDCSDCGAALIAFPRELPLTYELTTTSEDPVFDSSREDVNSTALSVLVFPRTPTYEFAQMGNNGNSVVIVFDSNTNKGSESTTVPADDSNSDAFACAAVLEPSFSESALDLSRQQCTWTSPTELMVDLSGSSFDQVSGQYVAIVPGTIFSEALGFSEVAQTYFEADPLHSPSSLSVTGAFVIRPPDAPVVPNLASVTSPDFVGNCDALVLNAASVPSSGGAPSVYTWSLDSPAVPGGDVADVLAEANANNFDRVCCLPNHDTRTTMTTMQSTHLIPTSDLALSHHIYNLLPHSPLHSIFHISLHHIPETR